MKILAGILLTMVWGNAFVLDGFMIGQKKVDNDVKSFAKSDSIATVLFEITSPERNHVSYIFGTHHAFGNAFFDSLKNAKQKLLTSEILIKENLNIPGHLAEDIINRRSAHTQWEKYLAKKDMDFVEHIFAQSNVDIHKMTPTELHVFLNRYYKKKVCGAKVNSDTYLSLDDYIASIGESASLQLVGLETTEEQLALIRKDVEGMPRKVHKKRLTSIIELIRQEKSSACAEIDWYRNMDFDYRFSQPCQNALILTNRNNKWMTVIDSHLQASNCFIAVGLSHLMYTCGLLNQLESLGYMVTPIPVK